MAKEEMKIIQVTDVIERIKDVISKDYPNSKVFDKNVAYELRTSPGALAVQKSRNLISYDALTMFCIRRKVNTNWLFFGIGDMEMDHAKKDL
ncbi:hypothetical protein [Sulfurimonas sp. HSL-1716]|uniref:hypothetical protein n=1 Tax=Hydrocurvibacter sulfurireducens TaxID=3131937 RepID=UPI0031F9DD9E